MFISSLIPPIKSVGYFQTSAARTDARVTSNLRVANSGLGGRTTRVHGVARLSVFLKCVFGVRRLVSALARGDLWPLRTRIAEALARGQGRLKITLEACNPISMNAPWISLRKERNRVAAKRFRTIEILRHSCIENRCLHWRSILR